MRPTPRKGFTIIELLVAVGVTALLVTLMINIVTTVLTNWNRTSGTLSSGNQARLVLDQISQDLQGAILKTDGNVWLAASIQLSSPITGDDKQDWPTTAKPVDTNATPATSNDSLRLIPAAAGERLELEDYRFGLAGVWLRFFTTPSGENNSLTTISAPRAVSYQIIRRQVGGAGSAYVYQLFRSEVFPNETFNAGYDLYNNAADTENTYNNPDSTGAGQKPNIRSPHESQVIASGIIDFGVRFFSTNSASGMPQEVFPVNRLNGASAPAYAFAATSTPPTVADPASGLNPTIAFPTVAEVMIRVLTPEGIRLLEVKEDPALSGNIPQSWWEIAEQNSNVYTRRIELKSTAL